MSDRSQLRCRGRASTDEIFPPAPLVFTPVPPEMLSLNCLNYDANVTPVGVKPWTMIAAG